MSLIVNINRRKTPNRGDLASAPCQYFPVLHDVIYLDILDCHNENFQVSDLLKKADFIIVGGGGLLAHIKFQKEINWIGENFGRKAAIWGAGVNSVGDKYCDNNIDLYEHVGIRDYNNAYSWVPCASCLSPLFEIVSKSRTAKSNSNKIGILENNSGKTPSILPVHDFTEAEKFGNKKVSMCEMLNFIASCDVLVSNSYHAVYWALLLEIPVIAIPTSAKFYHFKYPVCLAKPTDWPNYIDECKNLIYPNSLEECIDANMKFVKKIGFDGLASS